MTYSTSPPDSTDWSLVADWVSGVGSLAAVVVALWVALREANLRRRAQEDDEKRRARLVMVQEAAFDQPEVSDGDLGLYVTLHNYGDFPIHDCWVALTTWPDGGVANSQHIGCVFLGPGEKREVEFDAPNVSGGISWSGPEVWFLDSFGRRWHRTVGEPEPRRVLNYIDPALPEEVRREIARNRAAETLVGKLRLRISRGRWQPPFD